MNQMCTYYWYCCAPLVLTAVSSVTVAGFCSASPQVISRNSPRFVRKFLVQVLRDFSDDAAGIRLPHGIGLLAILFLRARSARLPKHIAHDTVSGVPHQCVAAIALGRFVDWRTKTRSSVQMAFFATRHLPFSGLPIFHVSLADWRARLAYLCAL